jgi:hypothetical protein
LPSPARCPILIGHAHCTESAHRRWPPFITAPCGMAPIIPAPDVTEEAATDSAPPSHNLALPPHCSAPHRAQLCQSSPTATEPPLSCPTRPKEAPHHRAPPASRACPQHQLAKQDNEIPPTIVFLREHLTGGRLLQFFPHPADPATSSTPPRSSSLTTSPIVSATPLALRRCLLPLTCVPPQKQLSCEHPLPGLPS